MNVQRQKSNELQKKALQLMPLGTNSNFRYWGMGMTLYVSKAKGCYLWDVDGNRYIDYRMGFGPIILGHAYNEVDEKVIEAIREGVSYAMTSELEILVAEKIISMCPGVEMVRLTNTGTEATMHAVRVARAYTGREKLIKFEGMYHGFQDYALFSTYSPAQVYGNRNSPIPIPASSGIPKCLHDLIITLPFNDFEVLEKTLCSYGEQVAAIIAEPCLGNCDAILPEEGFLEFIRSKCNEYGIVLILDEVKTGFRIARGGAAEYYGIQPDLVTYAKSISNGYPCAAFGGRREIMEIVGRGVAEGGTFCGNKVATAAAYATLTILQEQPILETIAKRGQRLMDGLRGIFERADITASVHGYPTMFSFAVGREKVKDQREWAETDQAYYLRLVEAAMERGVMPDYDPREPWFLCYSHSEADIDRTLEVMEEVVKVVKR